MTNSAPRTRLTYIVTSAAVAAALCGFAAVPAFATEAPVADAPAVAAPAVEAPVADEPTTETPAVDQAAVTDAPTPAVTAPTAAQAPAAEAFALPATVEEATAALAATPWETTGALDQNGDPVALDDPRAANFVGNAYFHADGTFDMFFLGTDAPKMHGNWDMRIIDGKLNRWIQALGADGSVAFERILEIVQLDAGTFTYRVHGQNGAYVDIVHTPTDYSVTGNATAELAAHPWETTGALDQDGNPVALDDPRAANFVGNAYFKADGTYTMFNLDDSPKLQGHWEMRIVNGQLVRWITSENAAGDVQWERTVPIVQLDAGTFTYRVPGQNGAYVDIVHTPTTHQVPGTGNGDDDGAGTGNGDDDGAGTGNDNDPGTGTENGAVGNGQDNGSDGNSSTGNNGGLATTGGSAPVGAIIGGVVALLSGIGITLGRFLRRRLG